MEGFVEIKTKWTSKALSAGKYEGWGSDGIPCYNTLCSEVRVERNENSNYDHAYRRKKQEAMI
jgi:hypothetical protein